jgi:hypothetical protein
MVTIHLRGRITPDGQLLLDMPENLPPGDVGVTLEIPNVDEQFTEAEIRDLLIFTPTSGAEVVAAGLVGGWEHKGITDSVVWVEEQRRKQKECRKW